MCKFKKPTTLRQAINQTITLHQHALLKGISYEDAKIKYTEPAEGMSEYTGQCPLCALVATDTDTYNCSKCPWMIYEGITCVSLDYRDSKQSLIRLHSWLLRLKVEQESYHG